ncbi:MAG: helix-turn-helix transcriptional regulator [Lachnospiraceae bacterium]|jgi:hypothetical protein|nr:helix-turn-helix transcriptional regulator [Lachnospiraceae bacterium]
MIIGNKINQLRKLAGMTQEQLAEKLNVSRQTISKWEAGTTMPDLVKTNLHNRNMMLLLTGGLLFLMMSILSTVFIAALSYTTNSTQYMLYQYIAVGEYASVPVDYLQLLLPSIGSGILGLLLCVCCFVKSRKNHC